MDLWSQRIENSQAIREAREIRTLVASLKERQGSPDEQSYLDRIDFVVGLVVNHLENYDPRLITDGFLNNLTNPLANLHAYLISWQQGQSIEYLTIHSQGMVDNILGILASLPAQNIVTANEAISSLRRSVSGYRLAVDRETKAMNEKVASLESTFDSRAQATNQSVANVEARLRELDEDIEKARATNQALATTQQTAFTKAETERGEVFTKLMADKQKEFEAKLTELHNQAQTSVASTKSAVEGDLTATKDAKAQIEEILGIVSEEALVAEYSKSAQQDRKSADTWRKATVGSIIAAIIFAGLLTLSVRKSATNWEEFGAKLALTLSFGALATYAARQSSEHRKAQRNAERMALQLAALKPYLKDINKTEQDKLLAKIAGRLFGNEKPVGKEAKFKASKEDPSLVGQLLAVVIELVKTNAKPS